MRGPERRALEQAVNDAFVQTFRNARPDALYELHRRLHGWSHVKGHGLDASRGYRYIFVRARMGY